MGPPQPQPAPWPPAQTTCAGGRFMPPLRPMAASPTQRTLAEARKRGWTAQVVEKWIPQARRRQDLFGCIDLLALDGLPGSLGIQATSGSNHSSRIKKAADEPRLRPWLEAGNRFEVWSWGKRGAHGSRKTWVLRAQALTTDDLT